MMYSNEFKNLVNFAYNESHKYYEEKDLIPNPFYIGFGNPNADILIVGQEKAIDENKKFVIKTESVENPWQWKKIIDENISDINYLCYGENESFFKNPLYPYAKKCKGTWSKYQKLHNLIYPELVEEKKTIYNSFFKKSFITEINHRPSLTQSGNERDPLREKFLQNDYYKRFKVIILAIGDYLRQNEVEEKFNVNFIRNESEPRKKLVIYKNDNQKMILLHTRQLSNDVSNNYLDKIKNLVKPYIFK